MKRIRIRPPADWNHHGVVFDVLKLASLLESLQHGLPGVEPLHTLQTHTKGSKKTNVAHVKYAEG